MTKVPTDVTLADVSRPDPSAVQSPADPVSSLTADQLRLWEVMKRPGLVRIDAVGKLHRDPEHVDLPAVVLDPDGNEMDWVTRLLIALRTNGLSRKTLLTYAQSFLRAARCAWALGLDMYRLTTFEYMAVRAVLQSCTERVRGTARRALSSATLCLTEYGLLTLYDTAVDLLGKFAVNPVRAYVDGTDRKVRQLSKSSYDQAYGRKGGRRRTIAKRVQQERHTLSDAERHALLSAPSLRDRALFGFLDSSGPRIGEALSLTPARINRGGNRVTVLTKGTGGRAQRVVPVTDETITAIDAYLAELAANGVKVGRNEPIFRSERNPTKPLRYMEVWKRMQRLAPGSTPHRIRHTTATRMLGAYDGSESARLFKVMRLLGHRHLTTTHVYLHTSTDQMVTDFARATDRPRREEPVKAPDYGGDLLGRLRALRAGAGA